MPESCTGAEKNHTPATHVTVEGNSHDGEGCGRLSAQMWPLNLPWFRCSPSAQPWTRGETKQLLVLTGCATLKW